MTLLDVYDAQATRLEKTTYCSNSYTDDEYVMSVSLCVFDTVGNLLIRKTSRYSDMWDLSINTYVHHGETCLKALKREIRNLPCLDSALRARFDMQIRTPGIIKTYYAIRKNDLHASQEALQNNSNDIRFASYEDVLTLMDHGKFPAYDPKILKHLFAFGLYQCPAI